MTVNGSKLKVERLTKTFVLHNRGGTEVQGFHEVSFQVRCGELHALHGPSGAGKSSILKSIYRTYCPQLGSVLFRRTGGETIDLVKCDESQVLDLRRREIGFVTQFLKILPRISALDVVAQPLVELGEARDAALAQACELLVSLGIRRELLSLSPLTFSGGEQQRVNIARAVIAPKELILLDEPTASLDAQSSGVVLDILEQLKRKGISMVAIFHDQKKIDRVADSASLIERSTG